MDRFVSTFTEIILTPRGGFLSAGPSAPSSNALATDTSSLDVVLSALDARGESLAQNIDGLLEGLPGFKRARTNPPSCSTVTFRSSASIRTDALCFLKRFAHMPVWQPTSRSSDWGRNSKCGSLRAFKSAARVPAKRCKTTAPPRAALLPGAGGRGRRGRSTGMTARRGTPAGAGRTQRDTAPRSRASRSECFTPSHRKHAKPTLTPPSALERLQQRHVPTPRPTSGAWIVAIPHAIAAGSAAVTAHGGRLSLVHARFGSLDRLAEVALPPTQWCSMRACPPCRSTIPNAAFPFRAMGRWTCACPARGPRQARWSTPPVRISCRYPLSSGRRA